MPDPTTGELKHAFLNSGLGRGGCSFRHAPEQPVVYRALCNQVRLRRHQAESRRPVQQPLPLEAES